MESLSNAATTQVSDRSMEYKHAAVFLSMGYDIQQKYLFRLSGRRDGSSRFGPNKKFGNFGSFAAAWIASEEAWLSKILPNAISLIKFRGSYGLVGSDNIGDYKYLPQWASSIPGSNSNYRGYNGVSPLIYQLQDNNEFHWESSKKLEFAFESAFLNDRINMDIAWYRNESSNQLLEYNTGLYTGFPNFASNLPATVQNTGIEFSLGGRIINTKKIAWSMSFNTGISDNKLKAYPGIEDSYYKTRYRVGGSLNDYYVFRYLGNDPQTGFPIYEDFSKDGKINYNYNVFPGTEDDDRGVVKSRIPRFAGGFVTSFRFRNLTLRTSLEFRKFDAGTFSGALSSDKMENITYHLFNE